MSETFQLDKTKTITKAYLMINCESGSETQIIDELKTFPEIKKVDMTIGRHDILTLIQAGSADELSDIITMKIRKIPEIRCTTTLVCTEPRA
jgi:DNA-binding Lrp family transcriptional regulator